MKDKLKKIKRRDFLEKTAILGAAAYMTPVLNQGSKVRATPRMTYDDISLAQWALVQEIRDGKWKTLDFAKIAREDFDLNGISTLNGYFIPF